ncbi:serine/threonine-protein kinase LMTK3-like isoform X1 [Suricata suricatta]|uniref:serine/threonine-protein kinase LMTK3-like isoform X1 n=1 Tax=Suricata suricatta TaxID=37032 RepID=UPI0011557EF9|nr:serine/threonine-protein kinase LMTK3-like isoform X1 [Suricata suricatta]
MTRTPSFSLPAFEFALFPSQPGLPLPLLSPSIWPSSLLPFALQNRAMPSAKVSRCTSPNNRSGVPAPRRPPAAGAHRARCSGCPAPGLAARVQLHRAGRGAAVRAPGDTRARVPALGRFPVHAGKSPPARVFALAPASAAWIALLFLSGLQLAADPGKEPAPAPPAECRAFQLFPAGPLRSPGSPFLQSQAGGGEAGFSPSDRSRGKLSSGKHREGEEEGLAGCCRLSVLSPPGPESGVAAPWGCCTFKLRA